MLTRALLAALAMTATAACLQACATASDSEAPQDDDGAGGTGAGSVSASTTSASTATGQSVSSSAMSSVVSSSSSASSSSASGGPCTVTAPTQLVGCSTCGSSCAVPWTLSWAPVAGATHYVVRYACGVGGNEHESSDSAVDLCGEVGMCDDDACDSGVDTVEVRACNDTCCSAPAAGATEEIPSFCGGGVCC